MERSLRIVRATLPNGFELQVEATSLTGGTERDVVAEEGIIEALPLDSLGPAIESISQALWSSVEKVAPTKFEIEFGLEIAVEPGKLSSLLVKGSGKGNVKVSLTWEKK
jgi:Trypsin-co-occurring domain 1